MASEVKRISNPLEINYYAAEEGPVDALLFSFRNAPLTEREISRASSVLASIRFTQKEIYVDAERYETEPAYGTAQVAKGIWNGLMFPNRTTFDLNSIRDLVVIVVQEGKFFAIEDRSDDDSFSGDRRWYRIDDGKWEVSVQFTIDGKLDPRQFIFDIIVTETDGSIVCYEDTVPRK
jgi:hypothetical protein